jgi:hypothetical protein
MPDARDIGIRQSFQSSLLGEEKLEMIAGFAAAERKAVLPGSAWPSRGGFSG